jgi:hypothetical protein
MRNIEEIIKDREVAAHAVAVAEAQYKKFDDELRSVHRAVGNALHKRALVQRVSQ